MTNLEDTPTIIYRIETRGDHVDHVIADCNAAALALFHTTRDKFIGRSIRDFLAHPDFRQLAVLRGDVLEQRSDIEQLPSVAYQWRRDDGSTFTAEAHTMRRVMTLLLRPRED